MLKCSDDAESLLGVYGRVWVCGVETEGHFRPAAWTGAAVHEHRSPADPQIHRGAVQSPPPFTSQLLQPGSPGI